MKARQGRVLATIKRGIVVHESSHAHRQSPNRYRPSALKLAVISAIYRLAWPTNREIVVLMITALCGLLQHSGCLNAEQHHLAAVCWTRPLEY